LHKDSFRLQTMTAFNKKLLQGVQGDGFLEKSPPGRRRQKFFLGVDTNEFCDIINPLKFGGFKMTVCKMLRNDCLARLFQRSFHSHFTSLESLQSPESPNRYPLGAGETV